MTLAAGAIALNKKVLGAATDPALFAGGKITHSVCRWCYNDVPLEVLCEAAQDMGIRSVEITGPNDWVILKKYNLGCGMGTDKVANIAKGFNDPQYHQNLQMGYKDLINAAAEHGVPNVIVFSGNRNGMDDMVGLENCAVGLEPLVKQAEKAGIKVVMELLNSKVNHKDYMCDHTPWGVKLVEKIGSPNFSLLYDIYHMQIMEGDVIATIRESNKYIAHYHTGGVPGRHEIDDSQELYYPAIIKAIQETGYQGFLGQEFVPAREDKIASLRQGVEICTV
jgi:hydroxypyruvate isomerase